jgi:CBS domain-containing protein
VSFREHRRPLEEVTVSDVMTREVQSLGPDCSVEVAASLMRRSQIHRVLVMEDRRLLGVVTTTDLARTVAERGIRSSTRVA